MNHVRRLLRNAGGRARRRVRRTLVPGRRGPDRNRFLDPATEVRGDDDTHALGTDTAIRVEYRPDRDGEPDPGEVVWTWIPYEEDAGKGKDRPAVVIGRIGADLVGVPLTSKRRRDEPQVRIGSGSWDRRRRVSYARVDRVMALDPDSIRREGSVLDRQRFDEVIDAVDDRYRVVRSDRYRGKR